jgi:quinoprotein glucose dehydrogenase
MSTDGANQGTRWLPRLMGVLLLLMGLAMLAGGIKLSMLGGSLYYLLAGIGIACRHSAAAAPRALGLYAWCCSPARSGPCGKLWTGGNWCRAWPCGSPRRRDAAAVVPSPLPARRLGNTALPAWPWCWPAQPPWPASSPTRVKFRRTGPRHRDMTSTAPQCPMATGRPMAAPNSATATRRCARSPRQRLPLEEAWRIRTGDLPTADDPVELTNENTPLKANGMLYACTAHSKVLALDPDTGKEIWRFDPQIKSPWASRASPT